jgi:hypothetical protein
MMRAWARHGFAGHLLAFFLLLGIGAGFGAAQQRPKARISPAPRIIILPPKLLAGAQATLAVLDSQGRLLPNSEVQVSATQKVTTDVTGRALFTVPAGAGSLMVKIPGRGIAASARVVDSEVSGAPAGGTQGAARLISYPHVLSIHDRFTLEGTGFRGAADSNHVFLNGEPCLLLASSPVSLVALPGPNVPIGDADLRVTVAGINAGQYPVSAVLLDFSGPAEAVIAGSIGKLVVRAHGTTEPLLLEIRNGSPGVIQLSSGNVQRLKTSGGDENSAPVEVKFVTGGNYAVYARLLPADTIHAP